MIQLTSPPPYSPPSRMLQSHCLSPTVPDSYPAPRPLHLLVPPIDQALIYAPPLNIPSEITFCHSPAPCPDLLLTPISFFFFFQSSYHLTHVHTHKGTRVLPSVSPVIICKLQLKQRVLVVFPEVSPSPATVNGAQ